MKKNKKTGFTLIELMVSISIIGFLSSIILISIQGVRERARFSSAMGFYKHTQSVLFDKAEYVFNFDEQNRKSSGITNSVFVNQSGTATYQQDTDLFKRGFNFKILGNGSSHNGLGPSLTSDISKIRSIVSDSQFSIGAWYKPDFSYIGNDDSGRVIIGVDVDTNGNDGLNIILGSNNKVCAKYDDTLSCTNFYLEKDKWYYIVLVAKKVGSQQIFDVYVDGRKQTFNFPYVNITAPNGGLNTLFLGGNCCTAPAGFYDEFVLSDIIF